MSRRIVFSGAKRLLSLACVIDKEKNEAKETIRQNQLVVSFAVSFIHVNI